MDLSFSNPDERKCHFMVKRLLLFHEAKRISCRRCLSRYEAAMEGARHVRGCSERGPGELLHVRGVQHEERHFLLVVAVQHRAQHHAIVLSLYKVGVYYFVFMLLLLLFSLHEFEDVLESVLTSASQPM